MATPDFVIKIQIPSEKNKLETSTMVVIVFENQAGGGPRAHAERKLPKPPHSRFKSVKRANRRSRALVDTGRCPTTLLS